MSAIPSERRRSGPSIRDVDPPNCVLELDLLRSPARFQRRIIDKARDRLKVLENVRIILQALPLDRPLLLRFSSVRCIGARRFIRALVKIRHHSISHDQASRRKTLGANGPSTNITMECSCIDQYPSKWGIFRSKVNLIAGIVLQVMLAGVRKRLYFRRSLICTRISTSMKIISENQPDMRF